MNENFSHTEDVLKRTGDSLALSASEKNTGREKLQAFLQEHPLEKVAKKRSHALIGFRFVFSLILIVLVGSGAASAAEGSLPGSVLYPIKVRVTEPVRAALSFSAQARSNFEIERANRRLSEYAQLVSEEGAEEADEELAHSLALHVESAKDAIADLSANGEESDALAAATDLHATLSAHAQVLEALAGQEEATSSDEHSLELALEAALSEAENIASSSEAALPGASDTEMADAIDVQEKSTEDLANAVSEGLARTVDTFDEDDAQKAEGELAKASELITAAKEAEAGGNLKEALLLYTDANEKLGQLTILIEADTELGVDIIKGEETKD